MVAYYPLAMGADKALRALADPSRRRLLDRLHEDNGRRLSELNEHFDMTRKSVTNILHSFCTP
jgi:DNA-binding transcriptional ArsR family regulator